MEKTVLFALLIILIVNVIKEGHGVRYYQQYKGTDKPRSPRGFKNERLSIARGFGKRDPEFASVDTASGAEGYQPTRLLGFKSYNKQSFPIEWLVEQLLTDPELTRVFVQKFIDTNEDGEISEEELIPPVGELGLPFKLNAINSNVE